MHCLVPLEANGTSVRLSVGQAGWKDFEPGRSIATLRDDSTIRWTLVCQHACDVRYMTACEDIVAASDAVCELRSSINGVDLYTFALWMGTHSAHRGIQAAQGDAGQIAARVSLVRLRVEEAMSMDELADSLPDSLETGDVVTISEKVAAIAQRRVAPRSLLDGRDPKFLSREERRSLAGELQSALGFPVSVQHLTLIDYLPGETMTVGTLDPNQFCWELSKAIARLKGKHVEVVMVDSDTGVDLCQPLTGLPTVGSTPIGATAGVTYYECLRASAAAEYARGHSRQAPVVIVHPSERNRARSNVGEHRGYAGAIHVSMERVLHHGVPTPACWVRG
ncbi:hypothetical protein [Burkholderia ambifaria]|uniref:hypothetical protein n=1 Tax=Burkholderia ambifaria TaxID=152480 RepID=UPI000F8106F8|nr:hypothetical protein [Burkholderia ambifaria]